MNYASYNPKIECQCGRAMKSKNANGCKICGREKWQATLAARGGSIFDGKRREPDAATIQMVNDWLRKPLGVRV